MTDLSALPVAMLADMHTALVQEIKTLKQTLEARQHHLDRVEYALMAQIPEGADKLVIKDSSGHKLTIARTEAAHYGPEKGNADQCWNHIRESGSWELVQRRLSKVGVEEYIKQHGVYPPFITRHVTMTPSVRTLRAAPPL